MKCAVSDVSAVLVYLTSTSSARADEVRGAGARAGRGDSEGVPETQRQLLTRGALFAVPRPREQQRRHHDDDGGPHSAAAAVLLVKG